MNETNDDVAGIIVNMINANNKFINKLKSMIEDYERENELLAIELNRALLNKNNKGYG